jgi:hypothetical protein
MPTTQEDGGREAKNLIARFRANLRTLITLINSKIPNDARWIVVFGGDDEIEDAALEDSIYCRDFPYAEEIANLQRRDDSSMVRINALLSSRRQKRRTRIPDSLRFMAEVRDAPNLQLPIDDARKLFNLLSICDPPFQPLFAPDDSDPEIPRITVAGVQTAIDVWRLDDLKAPTLRRLLDGLSLARLLIEDFFRGDFDDRWYGFDDDDGDDGPFDDVPAPDSPAVVSA